MMTEADDCWHPSPNGTTASEYLTFRLAGESYAVDVLSVRELRGWTPTTTLPNAPPYVCGLINLRGTVLTVIDLALRFGLPRPEPDQRHVTIVVAFGDRLIGLRVDSVSNILALPPDAVQPAPRAVDAVSGNDPGLIHAIAIYDDNMIRMIDLDRLLSDDEEEAA